MRDVRHECTTHTQSQQWRTTRIKRPYPCGTQEPLSKSHSCVRANRAFRNLRAILSKLKRMFILDSVELSILVDKII